MSGSYAPIADYAMVGDCHGSALVSREGAVDWCCLRRFDADPVFWRLLDARRGGFLGLDAEPGVRFERRYRPGTNILETTVRGGSGAFRVVDFMPVARAAGASVHDYVSLESPGWFVRIVEGLSGTPRVGLVARPSPGFRGGSCGLDDGLLSAGEGGFVWSDAPWGIRGDGAGASAVELRPGERRCMVVSADPPRGASAERVRDWLRVSEAFWREWAAYCRYRGPKRDKVLRSALVLKMLTYAPTGAVVAAPTTSLPEVSGGARNWDYRYCWVRDAQLTVSAFSLLGYSGEAKRMARFLAGACASTHPEVQIMYRIDGSPDLEERELPGLEGYAESRPVRVGNGAYRQRQIDVYGEILDTAWLLRRLGMPMAGENARFLRSAADFVLAHWEEPEEGLWEMRAGPRHHVFGKIMSWVALDRAARLFGDAPAWSGARERIRRAVFERGLDPDQGFLRQAFDLPGADASLLLAPLLGFPVDRGTFERTLRAVERELGRGDVLDRYRGDDGLEGREGAFLLVSFWRVDALLWLGRFDEAEALFERLVGRTNDVGLLAEEVDPDRGTFLGNFPQAFSHLALVQSAVHLELVRREGAGALEGGQAERARREVGATMGLRALWEAFRKTGRVARLVSSGASKAPPE